MSNSPDTEMISSRAMEQAPRCEGERQGYLNLSGQIEQAASVVKTLVISEVNSVHASQ